MRINLVTPFADKDKAKALGARWDANRKVWYIVDVADLTPFMRWIPDLNAATRPMESVVGVAASRPGNQVAARSAAVTRPDKVVPTCECKALPWEDCIHTPVQG